MFEPAKIRGWQRKLADMVEQAGREDPEGFAQVVALLQEAQDDLPAAAAELRERHSHAELARAVGISKTGAVKRYGPARAAQIAERRQTHGSK